VRTIRKGDFFASNLYPLWGSGFVSAMELSAIGRLIEAMGVKSVLEIGVNRGATAKVLLNAFPQLDAYTGIEITLGSLRSMRSWQVGERSFGDNEAGSLALHDPRFKLHMSPRGSGDFHATRDYDLVFIDGNHSYDWVRSDTALAKTMNPSVIVWHDYPNLGDVVRAVNKEPEAVHVQGTRIAFSILRGELVGSPRSRR
jgi:hypothetical protein